jgi:hypothetical protein
MNLAFIGIFSLLMFRFDANPPTFKPFLRTSANSPAAETGLLGAVTTGGGLGGLAIKSAACVTFLIARQFATMTCAA